MKIIEIKQTLAEEILDQLEKAQKDCYVQSTENVISDLKQALHIPHVRYRRELLITLLRETDLEYIQHQDCPEILAEDIIKAIYSI